jgi:hypothetical protein
MIRGPNGDGGGVRYETDGVIWGGNNEHQRKPADAFVAALGTLDITGPTKLFINERFVNLVTKYKQRRIKWKYISIVSRCIVTIGSIVIPVLITLDDNNTVEKTRTSRVIVAISLMVSITNGLHEIFASTKRYISFGITEDNLVGEGWSFITLSGKYKEYATHGECVRSFMGSVEKIHAAGCSATYSMARKPDDHVLSLAHQGQGEEEEQERGGLFGSSSLPVVYTNH